MSADSPARLLLALSFPSVWRYSNRPTPISRDTIHTSRERAHGSRSRVQVGRLYVLLPRMYRDHDAHLCSLVKHIFSFSQPEPTFHHHSWTDYPPSLCAPAVVPTPIRLFVVPQACALRRLSTRISRGKSMSCDAETHSMIREQVLHSPVETTDGPSPHATA